ncbi:autophagy-related protein 13-domain-containing protein [Syncephalis fuscata]|nr:autophagy-related protein 13-domain-containing protein [Syncephalis fuscata]
MYRSVSSSSRYSASPPTSTLSTSQASQSGGGLSAGAVQTGGSGSNGGASGGGNFGSNSRSSLSGAGAHRLEQILQNFYLKTAQIITQSRQSGVNASSHSKDPLRQPSLDTLNSTSTGRPSGQPRKTNKWFNMELEDTDELRDELKLWKATAVLSVTPPPPMIIEVFVDCSDLAPSQIPVLMDGDQGRKAKIEGISTNSGGHLGFGSHRRSTILLESWQLTLDTQASSSLPELPTLYKRCIMFFRALFTYTRLLPSYRLCRRLRRSLGQSIPLHIGYRFTTVTSARPDEIQLEMPLTDLEPRPITNTHRFETVDTPAGLFTLQVTYRQYCELTVNDPEQLLSSSLVDMEENYFSPSLVQESRMRSLLQRDLKRDGELSMPSSPVNTSALHAQSWRTGSSLRPMPASFPNPAPSAFFSLGEGTPTSTISNGPEEDPNHAATLPLDGSPIFSPPLFSTTGHAPTESRMRSLLSQTSAYSTTDSLPPFSNPIDMHRLAHRSSRGSMKSVASRSSSRPPSIVSSSPRDTTHFIAGGHRASTSIGSAVIATTPSHINNNTTNEGHRHSLQCRPMIYFHPVVLLPLKDHLHCTQCIKQAIAIAIAVIWMLVQYRHLKHLAVFYRHLHCLLL